MFAAIKERFELSASVKELLHLYRARIIDLTREVDGASQCLSELGADGWKVAIVTNGSTKQQNAKIDRLGFRDLVDSVVVSETLGVKKPKPRIFEHAASTCGVATDELETCWMIGDSATHDIAGAQTLGMSTGWLPRGRRWPSDSLPPTLVVEHLGTLARRLRTEGLGQV